MDNLTAARWQMTVSLVFHIVFAAVGIGLPLLMVIAGWTWRRTGKDHYLRLEKTWAKAAGLLFAVGAVSGTALSFELGLLWPKYMELMGGVVGHFFGLEGFAFFIEAIFLGLVLYGRERMSPWAHWWCGVVVAVAGATSGVLVLGVNAWMQQPVGFSIVDGKVIAEDPAAVFKQYGWFAMSLHSTLACYMAVSFAVAGVYARGWLKGRRDAYHASGMRIAMAVAAVTALLQPVSGDLLGKFVFRTQPAKFAAMEGQFKTERYAPLRLGGWPDVEARETKWAVEVPGALSVLAGYRPDVEVRGLDSIPEENWPNVHLTHAAFQVMVGLGTLLMALGVGFWVAMWRKGKVGVWLARAMVGCAAGGLVALEAGWVVTEVGRQPWVIQPNPAIGFAGMRTADVVTTASGVVPLFVGFSVLYTVLGFVTVVLLRGLAEAKGDRVRAPQEVGLAPAM